jgi:hypothetical protein
VVLREDVVAAEHIVRPALFGAAGDEEHRRPPVLDLLRQLGVRQHLEIDDIVDVRLPGLGERDRRHHWHRR